MDEQLLGVEAQLEHVVEQREQRRQREGRHEDRDEAVLDDCGRKRKVNQLLCVSIWMRLRESRLLLAPFSASLTQPIKAVISRHTGLGRKSVQRLSDFSPRRKSSRRVHAT